VYPKEYSIYCAASYQPLSYYCGVGHVEVEAGAVVGVVHRDSQTQPLPYSLSEQLAAIPYRYPIESYNTHKR